MKNILLALLLSLSLSAQAAYTEFYCNSTGTNINAGSTTNATATFSATGGSWVGATGIYTKTGADLSLVTVGMWASVYADGATVTPFVARILAVDNTADTITVSLVAVSGIPPADGAADKSINVGGAWKGPWGAEGFPWRFLGGSMTNSSGHSPRANFDNEATFSITATIVETNGFASTVGVGPVRFEGMTSLPGDFGLAIIDGGNPGTSFCMWSNTAACKDRDMVGLIFQNNGSTGAADGLNMGGNENSFQRCVFNNLRGHGVILSGVNHIYFSEAYACNLSNTSGKGGIALQSSGDMAYNCISHHNTTANASGFQLDGGVNLIGCIAANNGSSGFRCTADVSQTIAGCSAFMNGGSGIDMGGAAGTINDSMVVNILNCTFVSNGSAGIRISNVAGSYLNGHIQNCAFGMGTMTNVSGNYLSGQNGASQDGSSFNGVFISGTVLLTANTTPWNAPLTGDFRNTSDQVKGKGIGFYQQTYTTTTWTGTTSYPDIGAAQATNSSSGGGSYPFVQ